MSVGEGHIFGVGSRTAPEGEVEARMSREERERRMQEILAMIRMDAVCFLNQYYPQFDEEKIPQYLASEPNMARETLEGFSRYRVGDILFSFSGEMQKSLEANERAPLEDRDELLGRMLQNIEFYAGIAKQEAMIVEQRYPAYTDLDVLLWRVEFACACSQMSRGNARKEVRKDAVLRTARFLHKNGLNIPHSIRVRIIDKESSNIADILYDDGDIWRELIEQEASNDPDFDTELVPADLFSAKRANDMLQMKERWERERVRFIRDNLLPLFRDQSNEDLDAFLQEILNVNKLPFRKKMLRRRED